ncbi:hypothetical protein STENM36S_02090 [Streptomyces tendae]
MLLGRLLIWSKTHSRVSDDSMLCTVMRAAPLSRM